MSGDKDVIQEEIVQILPTSWWDTFAAMRVLVKKATHGTYGIGRVERDDFIETFAGRLAVNRYINNQESPAMWDSLES